MKYPLVLVGPITAGKGTVAAILSQRLGVPEYGLDRLERDYAKELGMDFDREDELVRGEDFEAYVAYLRPYSYGTLAGAMRDSILKRGIIHCGAFHTFGETDEDWSHIRWALSGVSNIVLLLPSSDIDESVRVLSNRLLDRESSHDLATPKRTSMMLAVNERVTRSLVDQNIATLVIYTDGKTPEQVADEIIDRAS